MSSVVVPYNACMQASAAPKVELNGEKWMLHPIQTYEKCHTVCRAMPPVHIMHQLLVMFCVFSRF